MTSPRFFCCTELEVLDAIRCEPFDLRVALPDARDPRHQGRQGQRTTGNAGSSLSSSCPSCPFVDRGTIRRGLCYWWAGKGPIGNGGHRCRPAREDQRRRSRRLSYDQGLPVEDRRAVGDVSHLRRQRADRERAHPDAWTSTPTPGRRTPMPAGLPAFSLPHPGGRARSIRHMDAVYHDYERRATCAGSTRCSSWPDRRNRAEGIGKCEAADLFTDWLLAHLTPRIRRPAQPRAPPRRRAPATAH